MEVGEVEVDLSQLLQPSQVLSVVVEVEEETGVLSKCFFFCLGTFRVAT